MHLRKTLYKMQSIKWIRINALSTCISQIQAKIKIKSNLSRFHYIGLYVYSNLWIRYVCVCHEKKMRRKKRKRKKYTLKMLAIKIQFMQSNPMVVWLLLQFRLRYRTSNLVAVRCNKKWKIERKPRQQNIDVFSNA